MNKRSFALVLAVLALGFALLTGCAEESAPAAAAESPQIESPPPAPPVREEPPAEPEQPPEEEPQPEPVFFADVSEAAWYHPYIRALFDQRVLPEAEFFRPDEPCTRLDLVRYLYGLHLASGGEKADCPEAVFPDVPAGSEGYEAVMWAVGSGVTGGMEDGGFRPDGNVTREQCCTFLLRYAGVKNILLPALSDEPAMFKDSRAVRDFARSYVAACQLAGIVSGYENGKFVPDGSVTHAEAAKMVCVLSEAAGRKNDPDVSYISTAPDAYLACYDKLPLPYVFGDPVPESDPVPLSWFDDAVIVGDSVTVALQMYCSSNGSLGNAVFLASGSLSALNNNRASVGGSGSVHPSYKGVKMKVEDGVAACGAKNVYIMLGMNNFYVPLEQACGDMLELVENIKAKSPDVNILIESVTPVANGASVLSQGLTNDKIDTYNAMMRDLCREHGWYYLDVATQFKDADGSLRLDYCGDYPNMGIHFTFAATKIWVDYLISHVPEDLK